MISTMTGVRKISLHSQYVWQIMISSTRYLMLCLMTLSLRTCSKSTKASYLQQLLQLPAISKGLRCKVSSSSTCCTSNTSVFGRYLPAPVPKLPASNTRPFCSFPPLLFSARRRNKPRRYELSAEQVLLDLCIAN